MARSLRQVSAWGICCCVPNGSFDPVTLRFPLREAFALETVLHHWVKFAVVAFAIGVAAAMVISPTARHPARWRRPPVFPVTAMAQSSGSVRAEGVDRPSLSIRSQAIRWRLAVRQAVPASAGGRACRKMLAGGACIDRVQPAGSVFRRELVRFTGWLPALSLSPGTPLGIGRVAQGAHVLSHSVWTARPRRGLTIALYEDCGAGSTLRQVL